MAYTLVAGIKEPTQFTAYFRQKTRELSALIRSGAMTVTPEMGALLNGGGTIFSRPSWTDLDNTAAVPADDTDTNDLTINSISTDLELIARMVRAQGWGASDLSGILAGDDPMAAIADKVGAYWARELQRTFVAQWSGVLKDNIANDSGDYINDISNPGVPAPDTKISATAVIDAALTAGDSMEDFAMIMMHSVVYAQAKKNDLIDFIPDSQSGKVIKRFHGLEVVLDDGLPETTGTFDTWIFRKGVTEWGDVPHPHGTAVERDEVKYSGSGREHLITRVVWGMHPVGHSYIVTPTLKGGPANGAAATDFNAAASWNRVFPERKQIGFAVLRTTEAAS